MTEPERDPPVSERWRMPLRVVAVFLAYVIYRIPGDDRLPAGLTLGIGALLVAFVAIDSATLPRPMTPRAAEVAMILLGLALIALGLVLAVR